MLAMVNNAPVKERLQEVIDTLPPSAQEELVHFINYLQYKYSNPERAVLSLGGLWSDIDFDITLEEVRHVREETSAYLLSHIEADELPD